MHILFLSDNFPPEVNAPASRTFEHCREWVKQGHRVTVITCAPNFPRGRIFAGYRNRPWQRQQIDGIDVVRVWSYITPNEGLLLRTLDYLSYMVTAFLAALFVRKVDIIVGTSPQFFTACAACAVGAVRRRPWIFELRDIWPESIRAVGAVRSERLLALLERVELFLYRRAAAVIAVTHAFKRNLVARGIDGGKIHVVTNGVDTGRFSPMAKDERLVGSLGLTARFVAGYIGTMGMAHGLDTLLGAARLLQASPDGADIRLLMLGDGAERNHLAERAEREGVTNVVFLDSVPKEEVRRYWSLLDVSIIHLRANALFETVIPSKLFECMGMGIPVLHGVKGESADIVTSRGVGLLFEPEHAGELAAALIRMKGDAALRRGFAESGPHAARHYDRTGLAHEMLGHLEAIVRPVRT